MALLALSFGSNKMTLDQICQEGPNDFMFYPENKKIGFDVSEKFSQLETIGNGVSGLVKRETLTTSSGTYNLAIKKVGLNPLLAAEVEILYEMNKRIKPENFYGCQFINEFNYAGELIGQDYYIFLKSHSHDLSKPEAMSIINEWSLENFILQISGVVKQLSALYKIGYTHSDLKPQNILLSDDKSTFQVIDFGVAQHKDSKNKVIGSPYFMSSNKWKEEEVLIKDDFYALGLTLGAALKGNKKIFYIEPDKSGGELIAIKRSCFQGGMTPECQNSLIKNIKKVFEEYNFGLYGENVSSNPYEWNLTHLLTKMVEFEHFDFSHEEVIEILGNIRLNVLQFTQRMNAQNNAAPAETLDVFLANIKDLRKRKSPSAQVGYSRTEKTAPSSQTSKHQSSGKPADPLSIQGKGIQLVQRSNLKVNKNQNSGAGAFVRFPQNSRGSNGPTPSQEKMRIQENLTNLLSKIQKINNKKKSTNNQKNTKENSQPQKAKSIPEQNSKKSKQNPQPQKASSISGQNLKNSKQNPQPQKANSIPAQNSKKSQENNKTATTSELSALEDDNYSTLIRNLPIQIRLQKEKSPIEEDLASSKSHKSEMETNPTESYDDTLKTDVSVVFDENEGVLKHSKSNFQSKIDDMVKSSDSLNNLEYSRDSDLTDSLVSEEDLSFSIEESQHFGPSENGESQNALLSASRFRKRKNESSIDTVGYGETVPIGVYRNLI
jgi:serine/threonine protein kinase